jgi:DNA-binding beta-propeller fold protein YncE
VTSWWDGYVWVIDTATNVVSVPRSVGVDEGIFGVAVDSSTAAVLVTNESDGTVSVIEPAG